MKSAVENTKSSLPDTNQSSTDLSAIQLTSLVSIPVLSTSLYLIKTTSFSNSLVTILLSHTILLFIRRILVAMSYRDRKSAIDLAKDYLGKWGSRLAGLVFLISAVLWFIRQADFSSKELMHLWPLRESPDIDPYTQYSIIIGSLSTIFCAFGIKSIKWLSLVSFPILFISFIISFLSLPHNLSFQNFTGISISGLVLILGVNLALSVDLPTFFRHSRTIKQAKTSLYIIYAFSLILSICGLYFYEIIINSPELVIESSNIINYKVLVRNLLIPLIILVSTVCSNVFNIYACSVGWEVLVPKRLSEILLGSKEYAILGLSLTAIFISPFKINNLEIPIERIDNTEVVLCLVFVGAWFNKSVLKIIPENFERFIYTLVWITAIIVSYLFSELILIAWLFALALPSTIFFTKRLINVNS